MERSLHFLLVDDNPNDRALTERELKRAFPKLRLTSIITLIALESALALRDYDFVITDYHINWTDGMKVLAAVKLHLPHCPVIMFTGTGSEHIVAEAMKNGLDDYVVKTPTHFARLPGAVRNALERASERKAMQQAEARYRSLFEHLPLGLYRITPDGRILEANAALVAIAGCSDHTTLLAHNANEFFVSKENYQNWQTRLEEKDTVVDFVGPGRKLDGSSMWVRNNVRVVRDTQGAVLYYEGSLEEITEQVQAAQQMRKLSSAIEQTADSVMITNRDGVIEYVNPAFELITGYTSAEALGRKPSLMKSGQHDDTFYHDLWNAVLCGESYRGVFTNRRKDGSLYYEEKTITPLRDTHGDITHFVSTGKDISERIHAETSVRASEEHLRTIIDTEPECIKLLGGDGQLIDMNAAGLAMIQADSLAEVAGKPLHALILPEHRKAFQALTQSVLQGNKGMLVFEIEGLKGTRRWLETHAVPMTARDGKIVLLGVTRDITDRKRAEDQLVYLAHHDELTGLANRTLFHDRLQQAMIEAERHERLVAAVFMDLDRFKNVNDTLGHGAGDQLLKAVAERLLGAVRRGDSVARLSGDEFTIVLSDMAHVDDAARVAQKILDIFTLPFHIDGRDLFIGASLGITIFPSDTRDVETMLSNADIAMYRAKEAGRNNYQFYAAEMTTQAFERLGLDGALRLALERGQFLLHYQPIVGAANGNIIGVEALIRWQHDELGLVLPMQFIPLAEETGLIVPIGEWVLRTACAQLAHWRAAGFPELRLSVNLSVRQFRDKNLIHTMSSALRAADIEAHCLDLEITESILVEGPGPLDTLRELSGLGVEFSIDDFGTGYSSLSYLKRLPIDTLKIDKSFVHDMPGDADDTAIVIAIIAMAHSLGMRVVAEGVETQEQRQFLHTQGCDAMQGYYFSKPLPPEEITHILKTHAFLPPAKP